uniref:PDS5 cohesin associated factor A n=1 Tax=Ictidomys tridecemlineatus TaxID=43179 RepID=A0A287CTG0_ICTTR
DKSYISEETRVLLLTGKPKPTGVLGAVNKPLSATGRKPYVRTTGPETGSNINVNSELNPSTGNRSREQSSEATETGISENEENPVRIISVTPVKNIDPVKNKAKQKQAPASAKTWIQTVPAQKTKFTSEHT